MGIFFSQVRYIPQKQQQQSLLTQQDTSNTSRRSNNSNSNNSDTMMSPQEPSSYSSSAPSPLPQTPIILPLPPSRSSCPSSSLHPPPPPLYEYALMARWTLLLDRCRSHPFESTYRDVSSHSTALHLACRRNPPPNVVTALVRADPKGGAGRRATDGSTPLHIACYCGANAEAVDVLLQEGGWLIPSSSLLQSQQSMSSSSMMTNNISLDDDTTVATSATLPSQQQHQQQQRRRRRRRKRFLQPLTPLPPLNTTAITNNPIPSHFDTESISSYSSQQHYPTSYHQQQHHHHQTSSSTTSSHSSCPPSSSSSLLPIDDRCRTPLHSLLSGMRTPHRVKVVELLINIDPTCVLRPDGEGRVSFDILGQEYNEDILNALSLSSSSSIVRSRRKREIDGRRLSKTASVRTIQVVNYIKKEDRNGSMDDHDDDDNNNNNINNDDNDPYPLLNNNTSTLPLLLSPSSESLESSDSSCKTISDKIRINCLNVNGDLRECWRILTLLLKVACGGGFDEDTEYENEEEENHDYHVNVRQDQEHLHEHHDNILTKDYLDDDAYDNNNNNDDDDDDNRKKNDDNSNCDIDPILLGFIEEKRKTKKKVYEDNENENEKDDNEKEEEYVDDSYEEERKGERYTTVTSKIRNRRRVVTAHNSSPQPMITPSNASSSSIHKTRLLHRHPSNEVNVARRPFLPLHAACQCMYHVPVILIRLVFAVSSSTTTKTTTTTTTSTTTTSNNKNNDKSNNKLLLSTKGGPMEGSLGSGGACSQRDGEMRLPLHLAVAAIPPEDYITRRQRELERDRNVSDSCSYYYLGGEEGGRTNYNSVDDGDRGSVKGNNHSYHPYQQQQQQQHNREMQWNGYGGGHAEDNDETVSTMTAVTLSSRLYHRRYDGAVDHRRGDNGVLGEDGGISPSTPHNVVATPWMDPAYLISELVRMYPSASAVPCEDGRYPLLRAIETGKPWTEALEPMMHAFPLAVDGYGGFGETVLAGEETNNKDDENESRERVDGEVGRRTSHLSRGENSDSQACFVDMIMEMAVTQMDESNRTEGAYAAMGMGLLHSSVVIREETVKNVGEWFSLLTPSSSGGIEDEKQEEIVEKYEKESKTTNDKFLEEDYSDNENHHTGEGNGYFISSCTPSRNSDHGKISASNAAADIFLSGLAATGSRHGSARARLGDSSRSQTRMHQNQHQSHRSHSPPQSQQGHGGGGILRGLLPPALLRLRLPFGDSVSVSSSASTSQNQYQSNQRHLHHQRHRRNRRQYHHRPLIPSVDDEWAGVQASALRALSNALTRAPPGSLPLPGSSGAALTASMGMLGHRDDAVRRAAARCAAAAAGRLGHGAARNLIDGAILSRRGMGDMVDINIVIDSSINVVRRLSLTKNGGDELKSAAVMSSIAADQGRLLALLRLLAHPTAGPAIASDPDAFPPSVLLTGTMLDDTRVGVRSMACLALGAILGRAPDVSACLRVLRRGTLRCLRPAEEPSVQASLATGLTVAAQMRPGVFARRAGAPILEGALVLSRSGKEGTVKDGFRKFLWVALGIGHREMERGRFSGSEKKSSDHEVGRGMWLEEYARAARGENGRIMMGLVTGTLDKIKYVEDQLESFD